MNLKTFTDHELHAEIAHARNKRDAFAEGREPAEVMTRLRRLLDEQENRREARRAARAATPGPFSGEAILGAARDAARRR